MSDLRIVTTAPRDKYRNDYKEVRIETAQTPIFEARLAAALIEKWGMVAATDDGEDAAGRSKLRLLSPAEIVSRACQTAALAVQQFRDNDWMVDVPSETELNAPLPDEKE